MAQITLSGVKKIYPGGVEAVKGVDLEIAEGEFVVFVGPSGCGKSTLLRMIAGLETVSQGEIRIGDRVVNNVEPADRDIAMVFQNYALYPHMSVRQNLSYGLKNRKMPKEEITRRIDDTARILQITDYLDRKPRALSGGQRQRVAMGRAIVRDPAAFLFDEPLSNLDAKLRLHMRGEIKHLHRRLATTSVYVTHDQLEAMTLADKLVVLNGGRIEQVGKPLDLYRRPASVFVAGFLGAPAMNLLDAHVDGGALHVGDVQILQGVAAQGPVIAGLRPEDVHARVQPGGAFRLEFVEELGGMRLLHGSVEGQRLIIQSPLQAEVGPEMALQIAPEALHLFNVADGMRITNAVRQAPEAADATG
ncbi:sn-glycerol-3-phosphate ABC transporter ATP-binding protein UgpC [Pseudooceanicola sp. HF7]|uniref:sn-glycerol-3-phosphate ABC transporter ATP-binding protein UgpC n=1 Tax=Pseudooceanicola sp. HF7 TaxID=2721560 RepID=UPI00143167AF|nr:sn-glycerol-3-phosphate ABC transporter ATP-binding protein UgpC [Pseudooceanicola sp. HF7]NIZ09914.1 sn-glycerol-3-phosphate ABC transporter ATP-binding protein UgpC [Pseudooceanicola sp. HF7]